MAAQNLGRIWATSPTSPNTDPGSSKYAQGWVAEIPTYQNLNYINNRYDTNIVALAERGIFEWGNDIQYKAGALAWDETNGVIYIATVNSPSQVSNPAANLSQWAASSIQVPRSNYDTAKALWDNHRVNTSNPHGLTTEILNTYTKSVIDGKVAVVQNSVDTHVANVSNPHATTAAQIGAVPIAGGTYTGLVRHSYGSLGIGSIGFASGMIADAAGMYITRQTSKLGINSSDKAVFINAAATTEELLTEASYVALRDTTEASYVAPVPHYELDLKSDFNPRQGVGFTYFDGAAGRTYTNKAGASVTAVLDEGRFTSLGLYLKKTDVETLTFDAALNFKGFTSHTLHINFIPQAIATQLFVGNGNVYQLDCSAAGVLSLTYARSGGNTTVTLGTATVGSETKLTLTFTGTTLIAYLNGVQVSNNTVLAMTGITSTSVELVKTGSAYLTSVKIWNAVLTSKQVAGL